MSRHCGPGDTLLVAWLLGIHYRLQLRIVLKAVLRCEPVLDFAGDLGCLCFLGHRARSTPRKQIHDLAALLARRRGAAAVPGGRELHLEAVANCDSSGSARRGGSAKRAVPGDRRIRCHPRAGGTAAALSGAPSAAVLVLAHTGFSPDGRARAWWRLPMHRRLLVRTVLVPAAERPPPDQMSPWLEQTWSERRRLGRRPWRRELVQ